MRSKVEIYVVFVGHFYSMSFQLVRNDQEFREFFSSYMAES